LSFRASITILRPREDVERLWRDPGFRPGATEDSRMSVRFLDAPGDRGTEIHVELPSDGALATSVGRLRGAAPQAKVKDELRRFKQRVETGVVARSEGAPEGEMAGRTLKQRPAQPLARDEREKAGV
jgi:hypothetical protein